jgi:hypothetical protein
MKLKPLGDSGISWRPLYKVVVGSICEKHVYVSVFWDVGTKPRFVVIEKVAIAIFVFYMAFTVEEYVQWSWQIKQ